MSSLYLFALVAANLLLVTLTALPGPTAAGYGWVARNGTTTIYLVPIEHFGTVETDRLPPKILRAIKSSETLFVEEDVTDAAVRSKVLACAAAELAQLHFPPMDELSRARTKVLIAQLGLDAKHYRLESFSDAYEVTSQAWLRAAPRKSDIGLDSAVIVASKQYGLQVISLEDGCRLLHHAFEQPFDFPGRLNLVYRDFVSGDMRESALAFPDAWRRGDPATVESSVDLNLRKYPETAMLDEDIVYSRNLPMVQALQRQIPRGHVVTAAIGALHFVGPHSIQNALRSSGYEITGLR